MDPSRLRQDPCFEGVGYQFRANSQHRYLFPRRNENNNNNNNNNNNFYRIPVNNQENNNRVNNMDNVQPFPNRRHNQQRNFNNVDGFRRNQPANNYPDRPAESGVSRRKPKNTNYIPEQKKVFVPFTDINSDLFDEYTFGLESQQIQIIYNNIVAKPMKLDELADVILNDCDGEFLFEDKDHLEAFINARTNCFTKQENGTIAYQGYGKMYGLIQMATYLHTRGFHPIPLFYTNCLLRCRCFQLTRDCWQDDFMFEEFPEDEMTALDFLLSNYPRYFEVDEESFKIRLSKEAMTIPSLFSSSCIPPMPTTALRDYSRSYTFQIKIVRVLINYAKGEVASGAFKGLHVYILANNVGLEGTRIYNHFKEGKKLYAKAYLTLNQACQFVAYSLSEAIYQDVSDSFDHQHDDRKKIVKKTKPSVVKAPYIPKEFLSAIENELPSDFCESDYVDIPYECPFIPKEKKKPRIVEKESVDHVLEAIASTALNQDCLVPEAVETEEKENEVTKINRKFAENKKKIDGLYNEKLQIFEMNGLSEDQIMEIKRIVDMEVGFIEMLQSHIKPGLYTKQTFKNLLQTLLKPGDQETMKKLESLLEAREFLYYYKHAVAYFAAEEQKKSVNVIQRIFEIGQSFVEGVKAMTFTNTQDKVLIEECKTKIFKFENKSHIGGIYVRHKKMYISTMVFNGTLDQVEALNKYLE